MTGLLFQVEFLYPYLLVGTLMVFVLAWIHLFKRKHHENAITLPRLTKKNVPCNILARLAPFLPVLIYLGFLLMFVAMARPRLPLMEESVKTEGIDIILAMDISSSMLARDFNPNRMEACKEIAIDFVHKRKNDRIGLVIFAGEAYSLCPVTTDHDIIINLLKQINVGILEDNTAIGMGLATAVKRLKDIESKSRIIILLTDGENNAGYIDPMTATELAQTYGVKIYTIAVGTSGLSMVPNSIPGNMAFPNEVSVDTELLETIAKETNGAFYRATDNQSLQKIYTEIDLLEKSEIELNVYKRYSELFRPFLWAALCCFLLYGILSLIIFK